MIKYLYISNSYVLRALAVGTLYPSSIPPGMPLGPPRQSFSIHFDQHTHRIPRGDAKRHTRSRHPLRCLRTVTMAPARKPSFFLAYQLDE